VGVATPPAVHKEQVVATLETGAIAYCEKPVVKSLAEFDAIFTAEKKSGARAYFTPGRFRGGQTPMIKQYIDDGDMGSIYRADTKHLRQRGRPGVDTNPHARWFADSSKAIAGITGDMGLYFIDRAMYLTGWPSVSSVAAMTYKEFPFDVPDDVVYDVEEHVVMLVRTDGKLTFTFEFANITYHDYVTAMTLLGTQGGIMQDSRSDGFRYCTEKGGPWRFVYHTCTWSEKRKADAIIYEQLGAAAKSGTPVTMATNSREALVLHEVMQMAFRSARDRCEVGPADLDHAESIFLKK
jgi:predicted dehydrogenase